MSTRIEWADETVNPLGGCTRNSPACAHCYAVRMAHRHGGNAKLPHYHGLTAYKEHVGPEWTGEILWFPGVLERALLRLVGVQERKRIFMCSMSDIAHEAATLQHLSNVLAFARALPQHTIMLLTKRPHILRERMAALRGPGFTDMWDAARDTLYKACRAESWALAKRNGTRSTPRERALLHKAEYIGIMCADPVFPLPNVWLGATIWDQPSAERAMSILLSIPAAKHFVSVEPTLGPVDLEDYLCWRGSLCPCCCGSGQDDLSTCTACNGTGASCIDWVICGGETGPGARPMHPDWARSLRDQCQAAGVPFFFKQWGEWAPDDCGDETHWICPDGKFGAWDSGDPHCRIAACISRLGSRRAGRVLDGRTWEEVPNV